MKLRRLLIVLAALSAVAGLALVPRAEATDPTPAVVAVDGLPTEMTDAGVPVCLGGQYHYIGQLGVYVGSCYDPPAQKDPSREYDPYQKGGPCLRVHGGLEGRTDVCLDTRAWFGDWGECVQTIDGSMGVYSTFCWDGRDATAPPAISIFFNGASQPCARVDRPTIEGYVDVCVSAV